MEEVANMTQEDVLNVIGTFPLQPTRGKLIITVNVEEDDDEDGITLSTNSFSDEQFIVSTAPNNVQFQPGQKILLDLEKMMVNDPSKTNAYESVGRIKIKPVEVDGSMYALINDNLIDAVYLV